MRRFWLPALFLLLPFSKKILLYQSPLSTVSSDFTAHFMFLAEPLLWLAVLFFFKKARTTAVPYGEIALQWFLVVIALSLPSFFVANDTLLSGITLFRFIETAVFSYMIAHVDLQETRNIAFFFALGLGIQGVVAAKQFLSQHPLGLSWLGESPLLYDSFNTATLQSGTETLLRSYGTLLHPNILGGFGAVGLIIFLGSFARNTSRKWLNILLSGLMTLGVFFSFSRSAILALCGGLFILFLFQWKDRFFLYNALTVCGFLLVLSTMFPYFSARFYQAHTENTQRTDQYQQVLAHTQEYPLGVGLGNSVLFQEKKGTTAPFLWNLQPIHNTFLHIGFETGIPAFLLFVLGYIWLFIKSVVTRQGHNIALLASITPLLLFDHYLVTSFQGMMLLGLVIGIVFRNFSVHQETHQSHDSMRKNLILPS